MHLVDDINFKAAVGRLVTHVFDDLANFIDAAIRCSVDLKNVDRASLGNLLALGAFVTRVGRRPFGAVQRFSEDARGRGFPHSPDSRKEEGVSDAIGTDGVLQSSGNVLL